MATVGVKECKVVIIDDFHGVAFSPVIWKILKGQTLYFGLLWWSL